MDLFIALSVLLICILTGLITYDFSLLTLDGSLTAIVVGLIIGLTHPAWIVLLFGFLISGVAVTRYHFSEKKEKGVQEGKKGERGYMNVLSTGSVPVLIAILSLAFIPYKLSPVLFIIAISTAASDTLASEIGVLSGKAWLITNFKEVEPGTNGGISPKGTLWALIGALSTSIVGGIFLKYAEYYPSGIYYLIVPGLFGFLGCMIDSLLGATLENRGIIGKGSVNFLSALIAVFSAFFFL